MKKVLLVLSIGCALAFISCESKKTDKQAPVNDMVAKNIAANQTVLDAFSSGDVSKIDSVVAKDFVDHTDRGDMVGTDSLKAMITLMHGWDKTQKMETVKVLADNDYVFCWMRITGTSDGSWGMPKGPYDMSSIEVTKFRDAKAIEHWTFMEMRDVMKMMPAPMPMIDTTHK